MLRNRLYYAAKPWLPWNLRMAIRRVHARRILARCGGAWPIDEATGFKPKTWPDWPEGKQFALVLTHDVESEAGFQKVKQLAELEMEMGFRSSFNFVPEGSYAVSAALRAWLAEHGFEVGVHDLYHDGKLFSSRRCFQQRAPRINHYLKEWDAVGFRSGFMHRNYEWLHDLNLLYDASSFDTDPFEPQPDGAGTISPFWVGREPSRGYVELPYTLVQDSTLFLLLRETTIDIWKRKQAWIAERGGMALLITHPDYMRFGHHGSERAGMSYPVARYAEFLHHLKTHYHNRYWHALPRETAVFFNDSFATVSKPVCRKRVCMLTYSHYESDNRVMRYATALAERGDEVDVVALNRGDKHPEQERLNNVQVHRLQSRLRDEKGKLSYAWRVGRFMVVASLHLARNHFRKRYDLIHVHNVPDFLVFAAWLPKLTGARILLDIHDILPEFYANKFKADSQCLLVRLLKILEKLSAAFADHVIIANHLWYEKLVGRSVTPSKCTVFINYVDLSIFRPRSRTRHDGRLIMVYPGGLQAHQGVDVAIRAFAQVRRQLPEAEFHICGDGPAKDVLIRLASELGLQECVRFFPSRPIWEVPDLMVNADVGVVAKRADSFGNEAYSTKIMELMSQGVAVVATRTKIDQYYFNDGVVRFFESGNVTALAEALIEVLTNTGFRQQLVQNSHQYVRANNWDTKKKDYLALVDSTCVPAQHHSGGPHRPRVQHSEEPERCEATFIRSS